MPIFGPINMKQLFKFIPIALIYILVITLSCFILNGLVLWSFIIAITVLFLTIQFFGAYLIGLNFHLNSINSLPNSAKKIMLTFDDGPHAKNTLEVISVLKKHNVNGLFFLIGKNTIGNEHIVSELVKNGNKIGNHSFTHHFWFDLWSTKKVTLDIKECDVFIQKFQPSSSLFRPPYGVTNPNIARALKKLNLQSVGWTIRSYDTSIKDVEKIKKRIVSQLKPGAIILLHDRLDFMPQLLEELIPAIKQNGYEFTIDLS